MAAENNQESGNRISVRTFHSSTEVIQDSYRTLSNKIHLEEEKSLDNSCQGAEAPSHDEDGEHSKTLFKAHVRAIGSEVQTAKKTKVKIWVAGGTTPSVQLNLANASNYTETVSDKIRMTLNNTRQKVKTPVQRSNNQDLDGMLASGKGNEKRASLFKMPSSSVPLLLGKHRSLPQTSISARGSRQQND